MDDAWQNQDIAPSNTGANSNGAIGIPTHDPAVTGNGSAMNTDDGNWGAPRERSPPRGDHPRRSSRSRSPGRDGGDDRSRAGGGVNPGNNLHVSGLSHKVDTRDLEAAFAKIGRVKKASVMYDPHSRESRGFGFVTMETAEEADAAVAALNATELMGKAMNVEKARRGRARTPTPGRYYGPPKRSDFERPYDPRPYDSRYTRGDHEDRRRRYDDRREYDRGGYRGDYRDDRERGGYGGGGGGGGGGRHDDRRYDDRRY